MQTENMLVCFVNTEQKPLKIVRKGMFQCTRHDNKLVVFELCEIFYPHPDAPEHAVVQLYGFVPVEYQFGTDTLIENAIKAVKDIQNITTLVTTRPIRPQEQLGE